MLERTSIDSCEDRAGDGWWQDVQRRFASIRIEAHERNDVAGDDQTTELDFGSENCTGARMIRKVYDS